VVNLLEIAKSIKHYISIMTNQVYFDKDVITKYSLTGPRYTSYPTVLHFHDWFTANSYKEQAALSNEDLIPSSLSLYFHLPFCRKVCFYCACNKIITNNPMHAVKYLDFLHEEIKMQGQLFDRDRIVTQLHWGGGTPTYLTNQQMQALMAETRRNFTLLDDDSGDYSVEIDPRVTDTETISVLREIGFNRISVGVQDFDTKVQKSVNRIQPFELAAEVINQAREEEFKSVNIDLIYGLPKQSVASFRQTLEQLSGLNPDRIAVYNYAHLPHMFKTQRQINEKDLPDADEKLAILQYAIEYLQQQGYLYIGMDHFAKPDDELAIAQQRGTLYRNFQGYSTHKDCDLVGMGITAISRIGNCYAQNMRSLEEYYDCISQNRIPVARGLCLDDDDRIRRDVISRLICNFYLENAEIEELHSIDFREYFRNELLMLEDLAQDGLCFINETGIKISPRGRLLIRNICMVFDKYLRNETTKKSYSKLI
jgi:oxygen-independent coproporphyrinogen III oxidase